MTDTLPKRTEQAVIRVRPGRIARVLLSINAGLILAHLIWTIANNTDLPGSSALRRHGGRIVDMNVESSIPTWFATLLLFAGALTLLTVTFLAWHSRERDRWYWAGLAGIYLYLSLDESVSLHEQAVDPMRRLFDIGSGPLAYAWVIPAGLLVVVFAAVYFRFFLRLPASPRWWIGVGGVLFLTGAIGMELVGASMNADPTRTLAEPLVVAVEEGLENAGTILFLYGTLLYLRRQVRQNGLSLEID